MANAKLEIERLEFVIKEAEDKIICNLLFNSTEPDNPFWGGGWKTKTFDGSFTVFSILQDEIKDYVLWENGREGIPEETPEPITATVEKVAEPKKLSSVYSREECVFHYCSNPDYCKNHDECMNTLKPFYHDYEL